MTAGRAASLDGTAARGAMRFRDREEAGRRLAERLAHLRDAASAPPVVLALPRGGVPVAEPVAEALDAPLGLLLVRKIGAPGNPEFGVGALVDTERGPEAMLDEDLVSSLGISASHLEREIAAGRREIERRRALYLHGRPPMPPLLGRTVVVVDDGIATGGTVRAALRALEKAGPARRVLAVPVAPPESLAALRGACDEVVALTTPESFISVGAFYDDFRQLSDSEVVAALDRAAARRREA